MQKASLRKKCMLFMESGFEEITRYENFVCCGFMILDTRFSCYDIVRNLGEHHCFGVKPTLHPLLPSPNTWEPIPHNYQHVLYG